MPIDDMSANFLAAQEGAFEPQRQNNALLRIWGIDAEDVVTLSVETFPLPKTALTPIELNYMNERRKVAGPANVEDMEVTFKDFVDVNTHAALMQWYLDTYDPLTGRVGLARNYKKKGEAVMYGPNGGFDRSFELIGLWISNFDPGDIDMTGEDKKLINLTLSIDKCIPREGLSLRPSSIVSSGKAGSSTPKLPGLPGATI